MTLNNLLRKLYYDESHPASFGGLDKLYKFTKAVYPNVKRGDILNWAKQEFTYTLHRPARKHFVRNKIYVSYKNELWQADLIDFQRFAYYNNNFKFILTIIDVFSKTLYAFPLKEKSAIEVLNVFKNLFKSEKPTKLNTDKGKEFVNNMFSQLCENNDVSFFVTENLDIKASVVERVNQTLKNRISRYFTRFGTRRWINVLDRIVKAYNNSYHRTIKMKPIDVSNANESIVFENMYNAPDLLTIFRRNLIKKNKFKIGDKIRRKYLLNPMDKSYEPLWTDTIYAINRRFNKIGKPLYEIKLDDHILKKRFYPEEIQHILVGPNTEYRIEKIVRNRNRNGVRECLVKFLGYPNSYNQWMPLSQVQRLILQS